MDGSGSNVITRLVNRMALNSKMIAEMSFDLNRVSSFGKQKGSDLTDGKHLFVSGLARSGTTALMRLLYDTGQFVSLTYADMPFVLAPNLWSKISFSQKKLVSKERAHKDGILIDHESPEALDEIFWKVFLDDKYIQKDRLILNTIPLKIIEKYNEYIHLILLKYNTGEKKSYLSKNNNNILRLDSILEYFSQAFVIIPFRNPVEHALSLLNQHKNFSQLHSSNPFTLNYMSWLGHHEFGLNQKPFYLNDEAMFQRLSSSDKMDIHFWLLSWLNYYSYALKQFSGKCVFFSYEKFCLEPKLIINQLLERFEMKRIDYELMPFTPRSKKCSKIDPLILSECMSVYNGLLAIS